MARRKPHLLQLPYDILHHILTLVLDYLPPTAHLTCHETPAWLELFNPPATSYYHTTPCPSILLVCKRLTRHTLRISYTRIRVVVLPHRDFLTGLSRFYGLKYVQHIDLALELRSRPKPVLKRPREELQSLLPRHLRPGPPSFAGLSINTRVGPLPSSWEDASLESSLRAEAQASLDAQYSVAPPYDLSSFYSPAYVVGLLARLLPRLKTIHLTLVENKSPASSTSQATTKPLSTTSETLDNHQYPLSALTTSSNIEPDDFNNLITSIRYIHASPSSGTLHPVNDYHPTCSTLPTNLLAKYSPLTQIHLPNLSQVSFFFTTKASQTESSPRLPGGILVARALHGELAEIRECIDVLVSEELFGDVPGISVFRVKPGGDGWQQLGLVGERGTRKGKGRLTIGYARVWVVR